MEDEHTYLTNVQHDPHYSCSCAYDIVFQKSRVHIKWH